MTMHMGVVAVAAPLIALGIGGGQLDPVRRTPQLFTPIPASVVELVVVWTWHAPALHHAARHDVAMLVLEQGMFLFTGLLVWLAAFGGETAPYGNRTAAGVVGLLLTSMHMTLLGALLALTPRPLFTHSDELSRLTPLEDQHLGGAIMLLVGGVSYLLGGLWLTGRLLKGVKLKPEVSTPLVCSGPAHPERTLSPEFGEGSKGKSKGAFVGKPDSSTSPLPRLRSERAEKVIRSDLCRHRQVESEEHP
jgi:putative membrane protein